MPAKSIDVTTPADQRWPIDVLANHVGATTANALAYALGRQPSGPTAAVQRAWNRGWCTDVQADRWSLLAGTMPHHLWPDWFERGLHPLDRLFPRDAWWRPAWEWAQDAPWDEVEPSPEDLRQIEDDEAAA